MKRFQIGTLLLAAVFAGGCDSPTTVDMTPTVRFFNATTGVTGNIGFTTNGQFSSGSAVGFGQGSASCSEIEPGTTSFAFGVANSSGSALSGSALATLNDASIVAGGDYTLVATGSASNPSLHLLDNNYTASLSRSQTAVRFANFARGAGATEWKYVIYPGEIGVSPIVINLALGTPSAYIPMASGVRTLSVLQIPGHTVAIPSTTVTLEPGSITTLGVLLDASGGVQLATIPRCR